MGDVFRLAKVGLLPFMGFSFLKQGGSPGKRRLYAILAVFIALSVMFSFAAYEYLMLYSLAAVGAEGVLLPITMVTAALISFFTVMLKAGNSLFCFRDYDLLLSLPIPKWKVTASKVLLLYFFDLIFALLLLLPAGALYAYFVSPEMWFYPIFLLTLFAVPMIPVALASVAGTLVMAATRRFKFKTAFITILTMALMVAIMAVSFRADKLIMDFASISDMVMRSLMKSYPVAYLYERAVLEGSALYTLMFLFISVGSMLLVSVFASRCLGSFHEAFASSGETARYKSGRLKASSPFAALLKKELKRFFSSSTLMVNGGVGVILFTAAAVAVFFVDINTMLASTGLNIPRDSVFGALPAVICFFIVMTFPSACSISLERNSLGILKSLPVKTETILWAKVGMNLCLTIPAIFINCTLAVIALKIPAGYAFFMYAVPLAAAFFGGMSGVLANLAFPSLDWTNEVTVIKQSAAAMIATLIAFVIVGGLIALMIATGGSIEGLFISLGGLLALCLVCAVLMRTWAEKRFAAL